MHRVLPCLCWCCEDKQSSINILQWINRYLIAFGSYRVPIFPLNLSLVMSKRSPESSVPATFSMSWKMPVCVFHISYLLSVNHVNVNFMEKNITLHLHPLQQIIQCGLLTLLADLSST